MKSYTLFKQATKRKTSYWEVLRFALVQFDELERIGLIALSNQSL